MIANIEGREAMRLRADILWAARRWQQAAEQIELLLRRALEELRAARPTPSAPTSCAPAIGYALADDTIGIGRLREKYAAKMAEGRTSAPSRW